MTNSLDEQEKALLTSPFDAELRSRYAEALSECGRFLEAVNQWSIVLQQDGQCARVHVELAFCLTEAGRPEAASKHLELARGCPDFEKVMQDAPTSRSRLFERSEPTRRLHAIGGSAPVREGAEVISIHRASTVRFSDVVGMEALKQVLRLKIIEPFLRPGLFKRFKKRSGGGVLLYGPPGCGKTMMARAIATECQASFTPIGISDVLNMWVGESERNLCSIFEKARHETPAVLFFDELDALAYSRSKAHSDHTRTTVNEFLSQLDGMSGDNDGLLILGATNMPWDVDEAMKRPGRFDRQIFVPPPDETARRLMFEQKLRDVPTGPLDYSELARQSEHFSGADIDGAIDSAKDAALTRAITGGADGNERVEHDDLLGALQDATASTLDWLKTARNLVKFGGGSKSYKDVEKYLRSAKLY